MPNIGRHAFVVGRVATRTHFAGRQADPGLTVRPTFTAAQTLVETSARPQMVDEPGLSQPGNRRNDGILVSGRPNGS